MKAISATEAARKFSDLLDAVEHSGESFVVSRSGKPVAQIIPAGKSNGRRVRELLEKHSTDDEWSKELSQLRSLLSTEDRHWSG